jgi:inhibitor of cysteine peptidase
MGIGVGQDYITIKQEEDMNFIKSTLVILFIASLLIGCTPAANPTPEPAAPATPAAPSGALELTNSAQRITVPVGVTFTINVSANPTTGYTWEVGFNQSLLKLVKRFTPSDSGMIGAGGIESFEFEGMRAGETEIYLNYKRSFEPNNPALESKTFKVTVTEK